jgi:hypothetical protein
VRASAVGVRPVDRDRAFDAIALRGQPQPVAPGPVRQAEPGQLARDRGLEVEAEAARLRIVARVQLGDAPDAARDAAFGDDGRGHRGGRGAHSDRLAAVSTVFVTCTEMIATTSSGAAGRSRCCDSTATLVTSESCSSRPDSGDGSGCGGSSVQPSSEPSGTRRPSSSVFRRLSMSPPPVISVPRGCWRNSSTDSSAYRFSRCVTSGAKRSAPFSTMTDTGPGAGGWATQFRHLRAQFRQWRVIEVMADQPLAAFIRLCSPHACSGA